MAKMTKAQLVSTLADKTGLSKKDVNDFFDTLGEVAYKEVKQNGECIIPGFGKMVKQKRKARKGRNPATGEEIQIPAKTVAKFRLSKAAKDAIS
jgi:DNA-binding protein HU-beta